ncbi:MAG: hypothetical protein LQ350_002551 [Teloschistes chrysophthalmus]|nr:MAG: hypothetical protein LQ350_002551 [Niorma chrysophthalma]
MKTLIITTAIALLTSMVTADPAAQAGNSASQVSIEYHGAEPNALRYDTEATDGQFFYIAIKLTIPPVHNADVDFSVSKIRVDGDGICTFFGTDKSVTQVPDGNVRDVGPPQTLYGGYCTGW